jgi:nucleoid-associated protein YgaU
VGLIDFVKEAGQKLFGIGGEDEPEPQIEANKAEELTRFVTGLGFEVENLAIRVIGDTATVTGQVPDQETKEKVVLAIGNTSGIAQVDDQMEVVTPAPEAAYHTVVPGDTLSGIAKKHYGNAMKYPVIFEANRPMLSDPNKIYPGQVLRIPPLD